MWEFRSSSCYFGRPEYTQDETKSRLESERPNICLAYNGWHSVVLQARRKLCIFVWLYKYNSIVNLLFGIRNSPSELLTTALLNVLESSMALLVHVWPLLDISTNQLKIDIIKNYSSCLFFNLNFIDYFLKVLLLYCIILHTGLPLNF